MKEAEEEPKEGEILEGKEGGEEEGRQEEGEPLEAKDTWAQGAAVIQDKDGAETKAKVETGKAPVEREASWEGKTESNTRVSEEKTALEMKALEEAKSRWTERYDSTERLVMDGEVGRLLNGKGIAEEYVEGT